tara:strand:+ start:8424 stop:10733 length:2310 start_codon:yes stop_codon:yes gene_type:complete
MKASAPMGEMAAVRASLAGQESTEHFQWRTECLKVVWSDVNFRLSAAQLLISLRSKGKRVSPSSTVRGLQMRKLVRPAPPEWWREFASKGEAELRELISADPSGTLSVRHIHNTHFFRRTKEVKLILAACSEGACHICGLPVTSVLTGDLEHFRPRINAGNTRKDRNSPRHYWWLLYDWDNLQLLCPICNRYKASLFPISGERAVEGSRGADLDAEGALLLNPFVDDPNEHLSLSDSGILFHESEQGKTTVEVYHLNREELVEHRLQLLHRYQRIVRMQNVALISGDTVVWKQLESELNSGQPLQAMVLDAVRKMTSAGTTRGRYPLRELAEIKQASKAALAVPGKFEATWIEAVRLRDFGPFSDLQLAFPDFESGLEPWLGIVGENGVGKSTFLKAVALALVDAKTARKLVPDASRLHNRNSQRRIGYVEIKLSDGRTRRVAFRRNSPDFEFSGEEVRIPVIALGAYRISGSKGAASELSISGAVDNLFDPVLPLADVESWLADTSLVSARDFAVLGHNLIALMGLPSTTKVSRRNGKIFFQRQSSRHSLDQMSDGFRSVIGLTAHIMKHLAADTPVMSEAEGTVLLDELELHLHPLWKKRIVTKLRELFPRVRFVITTHDPLCLRGLVSNESYVFRHNPESYKIEAYALNIRPGMDVDDLLTGGWFGLGTTYDDETEEMIRELSELSLREDTLKLQEGVTLPDAERMQISRLSQDLRDRLQSFTASEAERRSLADVVRRGIASPDVLDVNTETLQARLRQAFRPLEE